MLTVPPLSARKTRSLNNVRESQPSERQQMLNAKKKQTKKPPTKNKNNSICHPPPVKIGSGQSAAKDAKLQRFAAASDPQLLGQESSQRCQTEKGRPKADGGWGAGGVDSSGVSQRGGEAVGCEAGIYQAGREGSNERQYRHKGLWGRTSISQVPC